MKVGIIGYQGHAKRIISIIKQNIDALGVEKILIYHPTKQNKQINTNTLQDLLLTDCIFICSPTNTHASYLKGILSDMLYEGKIFCEKPPCHNLKDVNYLLSKSNEYSDKVYFNFNFRKSSLCQMIDKNQDKTGKIINVNLSLTHGLAFKKDYLVGWRSDIKCHPLGVLETVGIHWIDAFINLFGDVVDSKIFTDIHSQNGTAFDTALVTLRHNNSTLTNIFVSYASCKFFNLICQGTNGVLAVSQNGLEISHPRSVFDNNGFYDYPPIQKVEYSFDADYNSSLKRSVFSFLKFVKTKNNLCKNDYESSLLTNRFLLNIQKRISNDNL